MSNQLVRLGADGNALKPEYPVIEGHIVPEMNGEIDYDAGDLNRYELNYFALNRARILALFGAGIVDAKETLSRIFQLDSSRMDDDFGDDSKMEVTDDNVLSVIQATSEITAMLQEHASIEWLKPFIDWNGKATIKQTKNFGGFLKAAVGIMSDEPVRIISDEQLVFYATLADFLLNSDNGVGFS
jgi:hypothetical protein